MAFCPRKRTRHHQGKGRQRKAVVCVERRVTYRARLLFCVVSEIVSGR
jgi:hypothetical protein